MIENSKKADLLPIHVLEIIGNAIVGGMENYVYNLIQRLPSYGIEVTCLAPYESVYTSNLRKLGCNVFVTYMDINPAWNSIQFTSELIVHNQIDLIHAHLPRAHVLAGICGKLTGKPAIATVHGMDINSLELGMSKTTGTNMVVVCQQAYAQALALGVAPQNITLIPNGVDLKTFRPGKGAVSFREKHAIPTDAPLIGFVGRLAYEKGPDLFIYLARQIHHFRPEVHFALVGDGPMAEEIKSLIAEENLTNVIHLTGVSTNVVESYQAFDILAQTSRVEGMPFAILEAMACGLPVAAFPVGGVSEIIEVGTSGITSAPGDWMGLGEGIVNLLSNPLKLKQMGIASRKRVEEYFDISNSVSQLATLFRVQSGRSVPSTDIIPAPWSVPPQNPEKIPAKPSDSAKKEQKNALNNDLPTSREFPT